MFLILAGAVETGVISITEDMAGGIGVAVLLFMIAVGVVIVVMSGLSYGKYEYLEKERIQLQYGVYGVVNKKKEEFSYIFQKNIAYGIGIIIVGIVPLFVAIGFETTEFVQILCVNIMLMVISIGVNRIVWAAVIWDGFQKLLKEECSDSEKEIKTKLGRFVGAYWCFITAIYLGISLPTNKWDVTWIVWPVAGVLFVTLHVLVKSKVEKDIK